MCSTTAGKREKGGREGRRKKKGQEEGREGGSISFSEKMLYISHLYNSLGPDTLYDFFCYDQLILKTNDAQTFKKYYLTDLISIKYSS